MLDDLLVVRERLPVRSRARGLPGGLLPAAEHCRDVACRHRVVDDTGQVRVVFLEQEPQHVFVQADLPGSRDAAQQGATRQLVPERDAVRPHLEDPPALRFLQHGHVADQCPDEHRRDPGRDHRELFERGTCLLGQLADAGHDRVDDRGGHTRDVAGEHLGHEERVAPCRREHRVGVHTDVGEGHDRATAQRPQPQALHGLGRQRAEQAPQCVGLPDVVIAVGEDHGGGQRVEPPADVAQRVEGRVVRPVQVLHDEHRRSVAWLQLLAERLVDRLLVRVARERVGQRPGVLGGGVAQRTERPRREQVVARAHEYVGPVADRVEEFAHDTGLADAGLSEQQDDRAPTLGRVVDRAYQDL